MNFFDSISYPFRIWQISCLSPFTLIQTIDIIPKKIQTPYFVTVAIVVFVNALIMCGSEIYMYKDSLDLWFSIWGTSTISIKSITATIILLDSFHKRNNQNKLFLQFNAIDSILKHQLGIEIDYARQSQGHKNRLIRWMGFNIFCLIIAFITDIIHDSISYVELICYPPLVLFITLRVCQFTIIVDIIGERYRLLNEYINEMNWNGMHGKGGWEELIEFVGCPNEVNCIRIEEQFQSIDKFQLLQQLRDVSQLLHETNQQIHDIFSMSFAMSCFNSFIDNVSHNYFSLEGILLHESNADAFNSITTIICCINDIRIPAMACEYLTEEVRGHESSHMTKYHFIDFSIIFPVV